MKKIFFFFIFLSFFNSNFAQVVYINNFDTPEEQGFWTEYRMGDNDNHHWDFPSTGSSQPFCLAHDYPMTSGVDSVEDWMVSNALYLAQNGTMSIKIMSSHYSTPPDIYGGIWISNGSKDPADGNFIEIADLSDFPMTYGYVDTFFTIPITADTGYIAFKYKANYNAWLMIYFDDLAIIGAYPVGMNNSIETKSGFEIYPNPCNGNFYIRTDQLNSPYADIIVRDVLGKTILQRKISNNTETYFQLNVNPGIYFVEITKNGKKLHTKKLIVR